MPPFEGPGPRLTLKSSDNGGVDFDSRGGIPTTNRPLRSGKGTLYEGGLRVPLVIVWPGRTTAGKVCDEMVSSEDFYPTLLSGLRLGQELPVDVDGKTLVPLLDNPQASLSRDTLYWHFPHYCPRMTPAGAVRHRDWKLIHYYEDSFVFRNHRSIITLGPDWPSPKIFAVKSLASGYSTARIT